MNIGQESLLFELRDLSRYRSQLMGVATIMIILCHAAASKVIIPTILSVIFGFGNYGVDIFLFLSGLGCFYSLSKTNRGEELLYYKRRFYRIIPAYLIIYTTTNIIYIIIGERDICEVLLSLTALEYWLFHRGAWYISIIIPLYFISPLFYLAIQTKWKWWWMIGSVVTIMVLCSIPLDDNSSTSVLYNIQLALRRVPSFIIGMAIANDCKGNRMISILWLLLLAFLFIPLRIFCPKIFWGWLIVPLILVVFVKVIKTFECCHLIDKSLNLIGSVSLESYLLNISINALLTALIIHYGFSESPFLYGNYLQYAIVVIVGTLLAFVINKICKTISFK